MAELERQKAEIEARISRAAPELPDVNPNVAELLRSKADQEKPAIVAVDRHHNPRAFAALQAVDRAAEIAPSTPLFRRMNPRGGVGARRITPEHSGRVGFVVAAKEVGDNDLALCEPRPALQWLFRGHPSWLTRSNIV